MRDISEINALSKKDIFYYRKRLQNNIYHDVIERFYELAQKEGLSKRRIAELLDKDAGQINRLFKKPGNWTLETISDLLIAMRAELTHGVIPIESFEIETTPRSSYPSLNIKFDDENHGSEVRTSKSYATI